MDSQTNPFAVENAGETIVHPLGLIALCLAAFLIFVSRREHVFIIVLAMVCFISYRQCVAIASFNMYFSRILILVVACRALLREDWKQVQWNALDLIFGLSVIFNIFVGTLSSPDVLGVLKYRVGYGFEAYGLYLVSRTCFQDLRSIESFVTGLSILAMLLSLFFLVELSTGRNVFSVFGGVPEITEIRDGRLRCQGAFGHPILAGVFWATFLPLIVAGFISQTVRWIHLVGAVSAIVIVVCSASSTPLMGVFIGVLCWIAYPLRRWTRFAAIACLGLIVCLHFVMKAPVWSLIQRINLTSGNSGYHRYILFDGFIRHANEWWLFGSSVGTAHWGHFTHDTANHIVSVGVSSGIVGLLLFVAIFLCAFRYTGLLLTELPLWGWGIGVSLFVLCTCFIGISIWGQLHFALAVPLAMAAGYQSILLEYQEAGRDSVTDDASEEVAIRVGMDAID